MYKIKLQDWIRSEIRVLINLLKFTKIKRIQQTKPNERISQQIEAHTNELIVNTFNNNRRKFTYLKKIIEENFSTKAPYELLLIFKFNNKTKEVYVDLKPINILKKSSAPFMGTINKVIKRIKEENYYDLYFIVNYESEINKHPIIKEVLFYFVKDITNYTLYKNWQLQITINKISEKYGREPIFFMNDLIQNLKNLKDILLNKTQEDIDNKIWILSELIKSLPQ